MLGHQVGAGTGKTVATVAGAAGGAYVGNKIEQTMNTKKAWTVSVQYDNGSQRQFTFDQEPQFVVGEKVRNTGASIVRN